jgi:DNA-directed RNA polymerase specialized sigma24 family protein
VEDYTQKDIAKILHKPIGTVGYEYSEALKTLRKELGYEYQ